MDCMAMGREKVLFACAGGLLGMGGGGRKGCEEPPKRLVDGGCEFISKARSKSESD